MRRVLIALFDVATLGTIAQAPLHQAAGYIAFFILLLYLAGVAALPGQTATRALVVAETEDHGIARR